jgi:hypothetical protein
MGNVIGYTLKLNKRIIRKLIQYIKDSLNSRNMYL